MAPNDDEKDLLFLIAKYLTSTRCSEAAKCLVKELEKYQLLPTGSEITDLQGHHSSSFAIAESLNSHIEPEHLMKICKRLDSLLKADRSNTGCIPSLLGSGCSSMTQDISPLDLQMSRYYAESTTASLMCQPPQGFQVNRALLLRNRTLTGHSSRRAMMTAELFRSLAERKKFMCHYNVARCLCFDRTGKIAFTGGDDALIKLWGADEGGRLLATFRGHLKDITAMDVSFDNRFLASGSGDQSVRVWCLNQGRCRQVLHGHTAAVSGIAFSPYCQTKERWLGSAGMDGTICCWQFNCDTEKINTKPFKFYERQKPGTQISCLAFSPGGAFMACGGSDSLVRVYYFRESGPMKIGELHGHQYRVDGISFCTGKLTFTSSSRDGTAKIWDFHEGRWRSQTLGFTDDWKSVTKAASAMPIINGRRRGRPRTLVSWSCDQNQIVTAQCGTIARVWNAKNGELLRVLECMQHKEFTVVECHPVATNLAAFGCLDGSVILVNIVTGKLITKINEQFNPDGEYDTVINMKWSPFGDKLLVTDHRYNLLFLALSPSPMFNKYPYYQLFHTDMEEVTSDEASGEQSKLEEDPPFLVDIYGFPLDAEYQRLVPGRENLSLYNLRPPVVNPLEDGRGHIVINHLCPEIVRSYNHPPNQLFRPYLRHRLVPLLHPSVHSRSVGMRSNDYKFEIVSFFMESLNVELKGHPAGILSNSKNLANGFLLGGPNLDSAVGRLTSQAMKSSDDEDEDDVTRLSETSEPNINITTSEHPVATTAEQGISETESMESGKIDSDADPRFDYSETPSLSSEDGDCDWGRQSCKKRMKTRRRKIKKTDTNDSRQKKKNSAQSESKMYAIPSWITTTFALPYAPQIGDKAVLIWQSYKLFCTEMEELCIHDWNDSPELHKLFKSARANTAVNENDRKYFSFHVISSIQIHIMPPRMMLIKLDPLDDPYYKPVEVAHGSFKIRYCESSQGNRYLVLKSNFDDAYNRKWTSGQRLKSVINGKWETGRVIASRPFNRRYRSCPFKSLRVQWDSGAFELLSPWDIYPASRRSSRVHGTPLAVTPKEMRQLVAQEDQQSMRITWHRNLDRIVDGIDYLMNMPLARAFKKPVDLITYPSYSMVIDYPMDLTTLRDRINNGFYRSVQAIKDDVKKINRNARKFNCRKSTIAKNAELVCQLLLEFITGDDGIDMASLYRQSLSFTDCTDQVTNVVMLQQSCNAASEESNRSAAVPRGPATRQRRFIRYETSVQWQEDCKKILKDITRHPDSEPFRKPVDLVQFPNYSTVIEEAIDLGAIRLRLLCGMYSGPEDFARDFKLLFRNSLTYNINKQSMIYLMTKRLSSLVEDRMVEILSLHSGFMRHQRRLSGILDSRQYSSSGDDVNDVDFTLASETDGQRSKLNRRQRPCTRSVGNAFSPATNTTTERPHSRVSTSRHEHNTRSSGLVRSQETDTSSRQRHHNELGGSYPVSHATSRKRTSAHLASQSSAANIEHQEQLRKRRRKQASKHQRNNASTDEERPVSRGQDASGSNSSFQQSRREAARPMIPLRRSSRQQERRMTALARWQRQLPSTTYEFGASPNNIHPNHDDHSTVTSDVSTSIAYPTGDAYTGVQQRGHDGKPAQDRGSRKIYDTRYRGSRRRPHYKYSRNSGFSVVENCSLDNEKEVNEDDQRCTNNETEQKGCASSEKDDSGEKMTFQLTKRSRR